MNVITTFPEDALYAETCVKSLVEFWPGDVTVYFEGRLPPSFGQASSRPLDDIEKRDWFLELEVPEPRNYLWDAKRFCHKAFSIIDFSKTDDRYWFVDADVLWREPIPLSLLEELMEDAAIVYNGREGSYTETGILGFDPLHEDFAKFIHRYTELYEEGLLFKLQAWTDCHAFDFSKARVVGRNLTPNGRGMDNVFDMSRFGEFGDHLKGPRKREVA